MKRYFFIVCLLAAVNGWSQTWFDVGLKGGAGTGFLMNSTLNSDARFTQAAGFNYFFGGKVGINFGEFVGITCDVDYGKYSYTFDQNEVPGLSATETYKFKLGHNSLNVMPMVRYTKSSSYLELGPQFSFTRNPLIEDDAYAANSSSYSDAIRNNLTGIVFGFGGHMVGNEIISLMMGLRFNYVFSNVVSTTYEDTRFPYVNYPDITSPGKTSPLNVQLVMEINYSLGYIVKASCGRRTAFLTF
ncbi:MAG: outer membrane beta-barrel protein [Crocinitomicaceae bacterium]